MDELINTVKSNALVGLSFISESSLMQILAFTWFIFIGSMKFYAYFKTLRMINKGKNIGYFKIYGVGEIGEKKEVSTLEKKTADDS